MAVVGESLEQRAPAGAVVDLRVARAAWAAPRPVMVGLAGDSASGKTTLAAGLEWILGDDRVTRICVDDYHRFDRPTRERLRVTPLHPEANDLDLMQRHLNELAAGRPVAKPVYDHATGELADPVIVTPREVVIVEGLLPFCTRELRECFDVSVYLEPEEELRHRWKIDRDCDERGYEIERVVRDMRRREPDAAAFVRPQREHADIVVTFVRRPTPDAYSELGARILLRPTLLHPELGSLVASLERGGVRPVRLVRDRSIGAPAQVLEIDGDCPADVGRAIEDALWAGLQPGVELRRDRIGRYLHPTGEERRGEGLALAQLLIVSHLAGSLDGAFDL